MGTPARGCRRGQRGEEHGQWQWGTSRGQGSCWTGCPRPSRASEASPGTPAHRHPLPTGIPLPTASLLKPPRIQELRSLGFWGRCDGHARDLTRRIPRSEPSSPGTARRTQHRVPELTQRLSHHRSSPSGESLPHSSLQTSHQSRFLLLSSPPGTLSLNCCIYSDLFCISNNNEYIRYVIITVINVIVTKQ